MPDERPGCCLACPDLSAIELHILAHFNDPTVQAQMRAWHAEAKEEHLNALMTPTGRRRTSHPEIINV